MSVQVPDESGPLWSALVEILNSERSEKQRLKEDIDMLSKELDRARQLHLQTYKDLQTAETTMSNMVYPEEPGTLIKTPKQVLARREEDVRESRPPISEGKHAMDNTVTYDKHLKLQSTGTPVIGTLKLGGVDQGTSAKKVRFYGSPAMFGTPERRNLSQTLSASASPSTAGKVVHYTSPVKKASSQQLVLHGEGAATPSGNLLEGKWKERCLKAEYKQKMLEQQVSDLEQDMITMSLQLEDKLDLQDKLLVKKFEIKNIEKWQQYILRKSLLLVRALSRKVDEAMRALSTSDKSDREKTKGWKLVLQDINVVTECIKNAGVNLEKEKPSRKKKTTFDTDLDEKTLESLFQRIDADGDGLISLAGLKELLFMLKNDSDKRPMKLPAPVPLALPEEGDSSSSMKLGEFYKDLLPRHKKTKHFGRRIDLNVPKLNTLSAKLLKAVYFTYCSFGMGHGEERTQHSNTMEGNNFAKLCRECGIISDLPLAEADIFFAAVKEIYSRNLNFEEFLHAILMVSEESGQDLVKVITQIIDHGVPEIHVRTKKPMPPILKTASRPEAWQQKKKDAAEESHQESV
ncbi:EF-hand domain-containing protein [Chloropicon primus]|uniref:EF-hand domain-containing protein n=1 Tax=Chloropicon primus TaxID=1764295 RepID=A0A5B8MRI9_9CHLO|nr:hypothetical protein A3770_07p47830 [Chloropicon primus]UPR01481.1 EF-hand domain-containing protein [Chloropicon primus]|eukprot:QDZ22265.1 hypothetical protein A3770_07p47830 [Chloropicon primus]